MQGLRSKLRPFGIPVERLNEGFPILRPNGNWWESGVTFNPAAVFLNRSATNDPIITKLLRDIPLSDPRVRDGVVAVHYRARPLNDPHCKWNRSFIGLAVYTPTLELLVRWEEPVFLPNEDPNSPDHLGVEDPRITWIDDRFYMVYCGVAKRPRTDAPAGELDFFVEGYLCLAESDDLIHWNRLGTPPGNLQVVHNKDGVLFPDEFDGYYWMLHRPVDPENERIKAIQLARSRSLRGPWEECGVILSATPNPFVRKTWVGAGSVPIKLDDRGRYLVIYHTGNWLDGRDREYDVDAAIFDLGRWSRSYPGAVVESRIDRLMVPESEHELAAPVADSVGNVLFPCGSYEYHGDLYIVYGAADTYVLAAKVQKQDLIRALNEIKQSKQPSGRIEVTVTLPPTPAGVDR